jgi:hypothetical protein
MMKNILILTLSLLITACSATPTGPELTGKQSQATTSIYQTEVNYYETGNYYVPGPILQSQQYCAWGGYQGDFDTSTAGQKFGETVFLDVDSNGLYIVRANVAVQPSITRQFVVECVPWSSIAMTGGALPTTWHSVQTSAAVSGGHNAFTTLSITGPTSNSLCTMVGMGGPMSTSHDLSEVILASGQYQMYTQSDSSHGEIERETFGRCWGFANPINFSAYNNVYYTTQSSDTMNTPNNALCGFFSAAGGMAAVNGYEPSFVWHPQWAFNNPNAYVQAMPVTIGIWSDVHCAPLF